MKKGKFERYATLLEDGKIEIHCDAKSIVVRAVKEQDFIDWPDLEQPKAKRGRKKGSKNKVKDDGNNKADTKPSPE
jgi:hypothetical protein